MKLILEQREIEDVLKAHIFNTISLNEGSDFEISFTAGRGDKGLTAEIDINYMGVQSIDLAAPVAAPAAPPAKPVTRVTKLRAPAVEAPEAPLQGDADEGLDVPVAGDPQETSGKSLFED